MTHAPFLYAIAPAPIPALPSGLDGIDGAALQSHASGALCAITTQHDATHLEDMLSSAEPEGLHALALDFHHILNALSAQIDILPVRFGTALPSREALEAFLAEEEDALQERLEAVAGCQEWTLQLCSLSTQCESVAASPKDYLRQRHAARQSQTQATQHLATFAAHFSERLASQAQCKLRLEPIGQDLAARGCFAHVRALVARSYGNEFMTVVSSLIAEAADIHADVIGPEAPYKFSSAEGGDNNA